MRFSTAVKFTLVAVMATSLAACATRRPAGPAATNTATGPSEPGYTTPPPGGVSSNAFGALPGTVQDFVVNVGDTVYFDTDSYSLRSDALPILDGQSRWLANYSQVRIRIEGNADERGTREYNFALGARRANTVREYLISRGIAASRIETISYGKERPIDPGTGEAAWQHNRNAHTVLTAGTR